MSLLEVSITRDERCAESDLRVHCVSWSGGDITIEILRERHLVADIGQSMYADVLRDEDPCLVAQEPVHVGLELVTAWCVRRSSIEIETACKSPVCHGCEFKVTVKDGVAEFRIRN